MQDMFRKLREERADGDRGFTMIELLVVVVIIGVLVAIAIPLYMNYRKGADNKSAASDTRGAIAAVEQFYTENSNTYPDTQLPGTAGVAMTLNAAAITGAVTQTITLSPNNTISFKNNVSSYVLCGMNANGGGVVYGYNSANGGSVKKSASATLALCIAANGA
jgi:type IV pilus assembly protein PilA